MNIKWITWIAAVLLLLATAPVFAWRCEGGFVDVGDAAQTVLRKCGRPDFVYGKTGKRSNKRSEAYWYYDAGPSQLVRVLRFHGGVLKRIDTSGYGFSFTAQACTPADIRSGMSVYELARHCGPPARKRFLRKHAAGHAEIWTYDFGPRYLLQNVTIAGGQVLGVETASRTQRRSKRNR